MSLGPGARGNEEVENYRQMLPPYEEATALSRNYFDFLAFQFIPISENQYFNDYLPSSYTPNDPSPTKLGAVYIIISLGKPAHILLTRFLVRAHEPGMQVCCSIRSSLRHSMPTRSGTFCDHKTSSPRRKRSRTTR